MPRALPLLIALLAVPAGAGERIPWVREQDAALAQAGERRAPLLILFTGFECGGRAVAGSIAGAVGTGAATAATTDTQDFADRCELLEEVLARPEVVERAARFVPIVSDDGLLPGFNSAAEGRSLNRRYLVVTVPTLLFADPWGNEIIRLVGRIPRDALLSVLRAIPEDFRELEAAGRALRQDGANVQALVTAAVFYDGHGLLPVGERYYTAALEALRGDVPARRQVAIGLGTNLLRQNKPGEAARLFERSLGEAPELAPLGDALLFGWMMAELQRGHAKEARSLHARLEKRFPDSPYTARAKQNLESVHSR